jgi:hypothetical protein
MCILYWPGGNLFVLHTMFFRDNIVLTTPWTTNQTMIHYMIDIIRNVRRMCGYNSVNEDAQNNTSYIRFFGVTDV